MNSQAEDLDPESTKPVRVRSAVSHLTDHALPDPVAPPHVTPPHVTPPHVTPPPSGPAHSSVKPSPNTDTIQEGLAQYPATEGFSLNVVTEPVPLPRLGRYELLERLGGGGMGVVFRALDPDLRREVALKTIRDGVFAEKQDIERFVNEAQAIAKLKHANIISILDIGQDQGYHFFTMPLAVGGALSHRVSQFAEADPRRAVVLVEKIARAVQCAHDQQILHRDLKPANILLDEHDEPLVSDFGLVKFLDSDQIMTHAGKAMGTRPYMSPEQLAGLKEKISYRTDVWGLGILLYELLTDRRPFSSTSEEELTAQIRDVDPPRPRVLRPQIDEDLEKVILKCLRKDPADRYESARELADDLGNWLAGRPVMAAPLSRRQRVRRWAERHVRPQRWRWAAGAVLSLVVVTLGIWLLTAPWSNTPPEEKRDPAAEALAAAERWVKDIPEQLKDGKSVTLIGATGGPKWSRWAAGNRRQPPDADAGKPFYLAVWDLSLLELTPNPGATPYRFRAEVRHLEGQAQQRVGLYFGQRVQATEFGWANIFVEFAFDDKSRLATPAKGNLIQLSAVLLREPGQKGLSAYYPGKPLFFQPHLDAPMPWRQLAVEVHTDRIKAFWEGKLVQEISWQDLNKKANFALRAQVRNAGATSLKDVTFNCGPTQPLGLYVSASEAEFRNVVLEPIAENRKE